MQLRSLREINIKYHRHYYPDDIISIKDFNTDQTVACKKPYQNNLRIH